MIQCPSCKNTLQHGATTCPTCGSSVSHGSSFSSSYPSEADDLPYNEQFAYIEYAAPSAASPATGTHSVTAAPYNAEPAATSSATAVVAPVQPSRRSTSVAMIALLSIMSLLLITSGGGFAYYAAIAAPADLHAQATVVARTFLTAQVQGTAQAEAQIIAKLTALSPEELYKQATSGTPIIDDSLTSPDGNAWATYEIGIRDCSFINGAYHLRVRGPGGNICTTVSFFKNMAFQVQVTIAKGETAGLIFHTRTGGDYSFRVFPQGAYVFGFDKNGQTTILREGSSSAIITGLNQSNLLTVIALANHFYLYINQQPVANVLDDTYSSGIIGLVGGSNTGMTDIAFNNAKVWGL